jgi:large subunit ribosomal protein L10
LKRALQQTGVDFDELYPVLKGTTSIMFANNGNSPAKLIKEFRKQHEKPVLKGAYVQESIYLGDNMLDALVSIKTKEELIGDIILLLQSPAKNVISALQSGGNKLHGVLETLSKKEN